MKIVIFGLKDTAELAHFYLTTDSEHEVVAFCVDKEFMDVTSYKNLPVVDFESVGEKYPPDKFKFFAPMTGAKMNKLREDTYLKIKEKGYSMISYISSKATVFENVVIGDNCFILEDNTIQPFTTIGNNTVLWSGNHIGHHSKVGDNVFFTSHVVLSGHCVVENNCFLGVNSTIRDYTVLKKGTLVGMSASVIKDTCEWGVYIGSPAHKIDKPSYEVY